MSLYNDFQCRRSKITDNLIVDLKKTVHFNIHGIKIKIMYMFYFVGFTGGGRLHQVG